MCLVILLCWAISLPQIRHLFCKEPPSGVGVMYVILLWSAAVILANWCLSVCPSILSPSRTNPLSARNEQYSCTYLYVSIPSWDSGSYFYMYTCTIPSWDSGSHFYIHHEILVHTSTYFYNMIMRLCLTLLHTSWDSDSYFYMYTCTITSWYSGSHFYILIYDHEILVHTSTYLYMIMRFRFTLVHTFTIWSWDSGSYLYILVYDHEILVHTSTYL